MHGLIKALCSVEDPCEMEMFLKELLTDRERESLDLRWELMRQLKSGKTQRAIAINLHVSLCKVTRGNKILKEKNSISNKLLEKDVDNE